MQLNQNKVVVICLLVLLLSVTAVSTVSADTKIDVSVFSIGATTAASADYRLTASMGQTMVGTISSGPTDIQQGFWPAFSEGEVCCQLRADVNQDVIGGDSSDRVYLSNHMFSSGPEPFCWDEADLDADGDYPNISDLVYLVDFMFMGGPVAIPCP